MKLLAADAERLLLALAGAGNIAVGRDRHRKIGSGHIASIRLRLRRFYLRRLRWPEKLIGYPTDRIPMHMDEYRWQRSGLAVGSPGPSVGGGGCSRVSSPLMTTWAWASDQKLLRLGDSSRMRELNDSNVAVWPRLAGRDEMQTNLAGSPVGHCAAD